MAQHTQNKGESGDKQHTPTQPTQAPTHARAQRAEVRGWVSGRESRRARRLLLGSIRTPSTEHLLQASGRGRRLLLGLVVLVSCVTGRQFTTTTFATKSAAFSMPPKPVPAPAKGGAAKGGAVKGGAAKPSAGASLAALVAKAPAKGGAPVCGVRVLSAPRRASPRSLPMLLRRAE